MYIETFFYLRDAVFTLLLEHMLWSRNTLFYVVSRAPSAWGTRQRTSGARIQQEDDPRDRNG